MVRKAVYTRQDVIAAGLAVVEKGGLAQLSARRVADELGCSTAPVYSNFENMDDLTMAVNQAAVDMMLELTLVKHTEDPFLDMGVGVLEFARRRPRLYRALFLDARDDCRAGDKVRSVLLDRMARLPELDRLQPVERILLLNKVSIFTHGLASRIVTGGQEKPSWEAMVRFLAEVGHAILKDALEATPRDPAELAALGGLAAYPIDSPAIEKKE
jgi:AcrR family transcriptional regulator